MKRACAAAVLALALAMNAGPGAQADGDHHRTDAVDPVLLAHATRVAPLNAVADALAEQGRGSFADTYGNLYVDESAGTVTLYATDPARGAELVAAAKSAHPGIDTLIVEITRAAYSKKALHDQAERVMSASGAGAAADRRVYSAAVDADASGVTVTAERSAIGALETEFAARGVTRDIPVRYVPGQPIQPMTWRWNDTRPQIGGDVLIGVSHNGKAAQCTSGLAAEDAAGRDYLITASHCFRNGANVNGEGGPTPGTWTFTPGHEIGRISHLDDGRDAEAIDTGLANGKGSNSAAADRPEGTRYPVTSAGFSHNGQSVCQNGARSYYDGRGVPCGITVQEDDVIYRVQWSDGSTHTIRGVYGVAATYAATHGDSGGLVFAVTGPGTRQARGIVSAGRADGSPGLFWTEAPDILSAFGMRLNPHT